MPAAGHAIVECRKLTFAHPGGKALRYPDVAIGDGEHWLIHGPSGCGKSTWLHLLCGLLVPSSGRLQVAGREIAALSPARRDRWRGRHCGLVLQQSHLLPGLTVAQNLRAARYCADLPADATRVMACLDALGIAELADRPVHRLSQGQAQRAAVARAVVNEPALLLADEPTASLDDDNAGAVLRLLQDSARRHGASLIAVSHDRRLASAFDHRLDLGRAPA